MLLRVGDSEGVAVGLVLPSDGVFLKLASSGSSLLQRGVVPVLVLVEVGLAVLLLGAWSTGDG